MKYSINVMLCGRHIKMRGGVDGWIQGKGSEATMGRGGGGAGIDHNHTGIEVLTLKFGVQLIFVSSPNSETQVGLQENNPH